MDPTHYPPAYCVQELPDGTFAPFYGTDRLCEHEHADADAALACMTMHGPDIRTE